MGCNAIVNNEPPRHLPWRDSRWLRGLTRSDQYGAKTSSRTQRCLSLRTEERNGALNASPAFPVSAFYGYSGTRKVGTEKDSWSCRLTVNRLCLSESLLDSLENKGGRRDSRTKTVTRLGPLTPNPQIIINHSIIIIHLFSKFPI